MTDIKETRQLNHSWSTTVLVNESDRMQSYQMTIPARPHEDDTTLGWVLIYGRPDKVQNLSASSLLESYRYLLSGDITTKEAINRLRCLRREYQSQPKPPKLAGGET